MSVETKAQLERFLADKTDAEKIQLLIDEVWELRTRVKNLEQARTGIPIDDLFPDAVDFKSSTA